MSLLEKYNHIQSTLKVNVALVLATKYASSDDIILLAKNNKKIIAGENRVQDLIAKYNFVQNAVNNVEWHFIGNLQTNKVKYIIDKIDLIHSVNSEKLLHEIEMQAKKLNKVQKILLEVNFFAEKSKSGINKNELLTFTKLANECKNIRFCGIMIMAPNGATLETFQKIKPFIDNYIKNNSEFKPIISFGMSKDYLQAMEIGSNMVRIGSSIFK